MNHVYVVHRDDPWDNEIDVFVDLALAHEYADAINGHVIEEPVLHADDEYVVMQIGDARYECDVCGRIGNADDGIAGDNTDCPDEECGGTVHRIREEV